MTISEKMKEYCYKKRLKLCQKGLTLLQSELFGLQIACVASFVGQ